MSKKARIEQHGSQSWLSNFILGSQDGLVNVLGILLGVSAATHDVRIIFVAASQLSDRNRSRWGAVAYTSTLARRRQYLKEVEREQFEMKQVPSTELNEVRDVFKSWGYDGKRSRGRYKPNNIKPGGNAGILISFELKLAPVNRSEAMRSFEIVLASMIFGSFTPLIPFFFVSASTISIGIIASVILSGGVLFFIGAYEARTTLG